MSTKQLISKRYKGRGPKNRRYEEQGDRQALRGLRRAQGGPGIVKNERGHWVERTPQFA